ncbi:MAG: hypothetical protein IPK82_22140 [Polyangiaceae bacterium]|nr:hypothetical protein [Polyangiaceae bacterium]
MTAPGGGFGLGSPPGGYGSPPGGYGSTPGGYGNNGPFGPPILGGGPGPAPGGGYKPPKKKGSGGLIALVVIAVLLLGGIVTLMVFLVAGKGSVIGADPSNLPPKKASVAHVHLPAGCDVVMRASLSQMLEVPAVKQHLVPVLDELQASAVTDADARAVGELLREAGIDAKKDVKDTAVCARGMSLPASQQKFLFVIGGDLRPETLVSAWEKVDSRTKDKPTVSKMDGRLVGRLRTQDGDSLVGGQAADGAILFSNDEGLFAGAAKETNAFQAEYGLPSAGEAAVAVGPAVVRDALSQGGNNPFQKDLNAITRIVGTASLAQAKMELRLTTTSPQSAKGLLDVYTLVFEQMVKQEVRKQKVPGSDALAGAKASVDGSDFVITAQGTPADVDALARELARILREEKSKGSLGL